MIPFDGDKVGAAQIFYFFLCYFFFFFFFFFFCKYIKHTSHFFFFWTNKYCNSIKTFNKIFIPYFGVTELKF